MLTTTGNAFGYAAPINYGDGGEFLATVYSSGAFNSQGQASSSGLVHTTRTRSTRFAPLQASFLRRASRIA